MKQLQTFFKKMQLVRCHLLKTSSDDDVRLLYEAREKRERAEREGTDPCLKQKWQPTIEVDIHLKAVEFSKMLNLKGAQSSNDTRGLGFGRVLQKYDSPAAEEREAMLREFEAQEEEARFVKCLTLQHACEWVKWDGLMEADRNWQELIMRDGDEDMFRFDMCATEDQLPTPSMLKTWGILKTAEQAKCKLCNIKQCSLSHILSRCNHGQFSALKSGRYTWRHDSVLLALFKGINMFKKRGAAKIKRGIKPEVKQTKFVSTEGNAFIGRSTFDPSVPLFEQSDDWELQFDLDFAKEGQYKNQPMPVHIVSSAKRPDALIFSNKLKKLVWIELTVPWEENVNKAYVRKKGKHNSLERDVKAAGWSVVPLCIEVTTRGYIHDSWGRMSKALGMLKSDSKFLRHSCSRVVKRCSYLLYQSRRFRDWVAGPLVEDYQY